MQQKKSLFAEPVYSCTGDIMGFEILTRFYFDNNATVNTKKIIDTLSKSDKENLLQNQLYSIINKSFFFEKNNFFCSVNLDEVMIDTILSCRGLNKLLEQYKFIKLEIDENSSYSVKFIDKLRELSCISELIMDDFGAGNTNLDLLSCGVFNGVKLDKYFLWECVKKNSLVKIVSEIKHETPFVIAEGVETLLIRKQAIQAGVTGLQGWLYPSYRLDNLG